MYITQSVILKLPLFMLKSLWYVRTSPSYFYSNLQPKDWSFKKYKRWISLLGNISVVDESLRGRMYIFMCWTYTLQIGQILYVQPPLDACKHYLNSQSSVQVLQSLKYDWFSLKLSNFNNSMYFACRVLGHQWCHPLGELRPTPNLPFFMVFTSNIYILTSKSLR